MFRMFSFLPPIGSYFLALGVVGGTYYLQRAMLASDPGADVSKVWLVGGILAFLLTFGGIQRSIEQRSEAMKPRVSSSDVMQKLTSGESDGYNDYRDAPSYPVHEPDANTPLARVRARSAPERHGWEMDGGTAVHPSEPEPLGGMRPRSKPVEQF